MASIFSYAPRTALIRILSMKLIIRAVIYRETTKNYEIFPQIVTNSLDNSILNFPNILISKVYIGNTNYVSELN